MDSYVLEQRRGRAWCVLRLRAQIGTRHCCSGCLRWCDQVHDTEPRRIRDLPIFEHRVELVLPRVRVACPHCGAKVELLRWMDPYSRVTPPAGRLGGPAVHRGLHPACFPAL